MTTKQSTSVTTEKEPISKPKVLYFDIETLGALFMGFRAGKNQNITIDQIVKNPVVMCISWAWGDDKVRHGVFDLDSYDWYEWDDNSDYELVRQFSEMAQEADLVIGHNAKMFDVSFLRSRLVRYGLPDFKPTLIDDTYLMTKEIGFLSHKQDYLGQYLGNGRKIEHGHGVEWWIEIMRGNAKILANMVKYCDGDVEVLRKNYKSLKPYSNSALNLAVYYDRPNSCPRCGSKRTPIIRGYSYTKVGKYPKFQCNDCHKYFQTGKNQIKGAGNYPR